MKIKLSILLILNLLVLGCSQKALNINSSEKRIHYPGVASASPDVVYEIAFQSSDDFKIDKLALNATAEIQTFSLYSQSARSSIDGSGLIKKGEYMLSFRIKDIEGIDEVDELTLAIIINDKIEKKTVKVLKKDPIKLR